MFYLLVNWLLSALSLVIVAALVPGIEISGFGTAMIAAVLIGLANVTLGLLLKILTFPLVLITFGAFSIVVNALMLKVAAAMMPGFRVKGCLAAVLGAILLALVNTLIRVTLFPI